MVLLSALCVWCLVIAGATSVAVALELSPRDATIFIGMIGVIAFFVAFLPVLLIGRNR
jgi:hypothetical protein